MDLQYVSGYMLNVYNEVSFKFNLKGEGGVQGSTFAMVVVGF